MKNPFEFSCDNKRYHTLSYHNKQTFNVKIFKAVIDAGFTCPNKDGSKGIGGCIFCDGGSGYFTNSYLKSVEEQIKMELKRIKKKKSECPCHCLFSGKYQYLRRRSKIKKNIFAGTVSARCRRYLHRHTGRLPSATNP